MLDHADLIILGLTDRANFILGLRCAVNVLFWGGIVCAPFFMFWLVKRDEACAMSKPPQKVKVVDKQINRYTRTAPPAAGGRTTKHVDACLVTENHGEISVDESDYGRYQVGECYEMRLGKGPPYFSHGDVVWLKQDGSRVPLKQAPLG